MLTPNNRNMPYEELFVEIDKGTIKIPKFQREFVWSKEQTAALIDSLIKGFPIGAFTFWNTTEELRYVKSIGNYQLQTAPEGYPVSYVLDGQQRITSLYAVRRGVVYNRRNGLEVNYKDISIDLSLDPESDEPVVFSSIQNAGQSISVHDLLNKTGFSLFTEYENKEIQRKIEIYQKRLQSYSFSIVVIGHEYPIDIATEVFTRINTGGTELSLFEIMVAKTYSESRDFDLSEKYNQLISGGSEQENCLADVHYDTVDSATVLRCVALYLGPETGRRQILRIDKDKFIDSWEIVKKGIYTTVTFLRKSLRIPVSRLLPYNALLVPLTYFFINKSKPTREQKKMLEEYFWWASLSKRFSGAVDTSLAADRQRMDSILKGQKPSYRGETVDLSENDLIEQEFSTGEARCKALLCLYCYFGPKSFDTNEPVTLDNSWLLRMDSKNYHHFFPRKYLKSEGLDDWEANSVLNITIVDDFLNKNRIRTKSPSDYINGFANENDEIEKTMRTHLIDGLEKFGIWDDDYNKFLKKRARKVLRELRSRMPT